MPYIGIWEILFAGFVVITVLMLLGTVREPDHSPQLPHTNGKGNKGDIPPPNT